VHRADGCLSAALLLPILRKRFPAVTTETLEAAIAAQTDPRLGAKHDDDGALWIYCYQGLLTKYMAVGGGTVEHELLYSRVTDAEELFHSTFSRFLPPIMTEGLRPGARDIHMWDKENSVKRGRGGADCVLRVDAAGLLHDGYTIWLAGNGVYLVESVIPPKYLTLIIT
jgi:RNA:NAD 2'-phosphotransferase (TPT1/KptA family)